MNSLLSRVSLVLIVLTLTFLQSCEKPSKFKSQLQVDEPRKVSVFLTDGPMDLKNVFIDVQKVEIKIDNDSSSSSDDDDDDDDKDDDDHLSDKDEHGEWKTLVFEPKVIDVLKLQNGAEMLLGSIEVLKDVEKVRVTLGPNNTVVDENDVTHNLVLSNATNNLLYIKIGDDDCDKDDSTNSEEIRVDFDLSKSIQFLNGKYYLKPKLHSFSNSGYGEIEGKVLPEGIKAKVTISNGQGEPSIGYPDKKGRFKVRGLKAGTYSVLFEAAGRTSKTVNGVEVRKGKDVELNTVTLN
ncbi:MAG: hypothetical protein RLZZ204_728 [Bacteroidota bacterium]|jgi:hypothetical protein